MDEMVRFKVRYVKCNMRFNYGITIQHDRDLWTRQKSRRR